MREFVNQDTNEPMTVQEAREKYGKDGLLICPLCGASNWSAGASCDEGAIDFYFLECGECQTYLVDEGE